LNWDYNEESTVYGYKLSNNSCPIFVNYHKEEGIASSTKFPEKFLNSSQFLWYTKPQRKMTNSTIVAIKNHNDILRLPFFMKKHNGEGTDFYYMGDVKPIDNTFQETTIKNDHNKDVPVVKVVLELKNPVENSIYDYITYVELHDDFSQVPASKTEETIQPLINPIPLYNFYAAAGSFSEMQSNNDFTLIAGPDNLVSNNEYFACKINGESMNRVIPNGSICLFKTYDGGSRNGKIVLVENSDIQDPDFNSAFTIKTYSSEKVATADSWEHTSIVLRPNSIDSTYKNIVIQEADAQNIRVVGEFVKILD
jgi:SOS-response transcriptional repressor LexA